MNIDWPTSSTVEGTPGSAVEAPPSASLHVEQATVPSHLLDGGEVVVLAIKPSLWTVLFGSFQWLCGAAVVIVLDRWFSHALSAALHVPVIQVAVALAALRVGLAVMQWVSRVYVLTNRRIMRIRGVFRADLFACPLVQIIGSQVTAGPHEAALRLGTIRFNTGHTTGDGSWYHVARPDEVHAEIRRALERAIDRHP